MVVLQFYFGGTDWFDGVYVSYVVAPVCASPATTSSPPPPKKGISLYFPAPHCHPVSGYLALLLQLVQRFYDPQQGSILLNGVALPHIDNVYLHQSIALVAQEPLVFADTIKSNILFGVHRTNVTQVRRGVGGLAAVIKSMRRLSRLLRHCDGCGGCGGCGIFGGCSWCTHDGKAERCCPCRLDVGGP